jgi:hypothetical protein
MLGNMQLVGQQVYEVIMEDANPATPAEQQSGSLEQSKTSTGLTQGQPVSWTSGTGNTMSGSVVGPSKNPNETLITLNNGSQTSVSTQKLQTASLTNFRIIEG